MKLPLEVSKDVQAKMEAQLYKVQALLTIQY
jgi:hypothetical protein